MNIGPVHILIVHNSKDVEYEILHPMDCKSYIDAPTKIEVYDCGVDSEIYNVGLFDALGIDFLPMGEHFIRHWWDKYYTYASYSYEYESGLEFCDKHGQETLDVRHLF